MAGDLNLTQKLEKLNRIGIALSSERNLRKLLDMIVREARALTNCDACSLYIVIGNQLSFEVSQSAMLGESTFAPTTFPMDKSRISGYVALTGKSLNIEDVYNLPQDAEYGFREDFDWMTGYKTKSVLAVAMRDHQGNIIGVLQLINALDGLGDNVPENVVPFREEYVGLVCSLASQAAVAICNARLLEEIKELFASFVQFCAAEIDARDPSHAGHSRRVRALAIRMARAVNEAQDVRFRGITFSEDAIEALSYAAWLHDIGKLGVSEVLLTKGNKLSDERAEIIRLRFELAKRTLQLRAATKPPDAGMKAVTAALDEGLELIMEKRKPGPLADEEVQRLKRIATLGFDGLDEMTAPLLTDEELKNLLIPRGSLTREEYKQVQMHAQYTAEFLRQIPFSGHLCDIAAVASEHHEMLDGSGYPRGLHSEEIGLQPRILAVADVFDAMVAADRPYRKAIPIENALDILREEAARGRLDTDLVELFIEKKLYSGIE